MGKITKRTPRQQANLWALFNTLKYDHDPQNFKMDRYVDLLGSGPMRLNADDPYDTQCGTPACVSGHYACFRGRDAEYAEALHEGKGLREFGVTTDELGYMFDSHFWHPVENHQVFRDNDLSTAASRVLDVLYGGERA